MNIVTIVGSLRKDSYNMQLAETIQERYQDKLDLTIADIGALPHYNQDDENDPAQVVKDFKTAVAQADGVIIITPEYNWSIPGVLKNALDWTSRVDKVFVGKPVMTMGATLGMAGTVRAQGHLRQILGSAGMQAKVLSPGANEILIPFANQKFDEQTKRLTDEGTLEFIDARIEALIALIKSA